MVGERPESRGGSRAHAARAAQPLGGGHGLATCGRSRARCSSSTSAT